jgi:hypothetical protein
MDRIDQLLPRLNADGNAPAKAEETWPPTWQDSKRHLSLNGLMSGWFLMAACDRWDFYIPDQHEAPEEWNALGHIWRTDCGPLFDAEFIGAIEAHRADPACGMFQPSTADINRQAIRLRERRAEQAKEAKASGIHAAAPEPCRSAQGTRAGPYCQHAGRSTEGPRPKGNPRLIRDAHVPPRPRRSDGGRIPIRFLDEVLLHHTGRLGSTVSPALHYTGCTFSAAGPFCPSTTSNVTFWPSCNDLKPSP